MHVYEPEQDGPWPAVLMYMDAVGIRPAMMEIAERIADEGYCVLLPNLFYRVEFDVSRGLELFSNPEFRTDMMTRVMPSASAANVMRDTECFLKFLKDQPEVELAVRGTLADTYNELVLYPEAERHARAALDLSRRLRGNEI